jgi:mono/diheme cytochrome c family protein
VQTRFARQQNRPLGRGTHTKGVCVRATFEVFDLANTIDSTLARRLARGLFARPGVYPATARFANAASTFRPDSDPDVRALSFAVQVPAGVVDAQPFQITRYWSNVPFLHGEDEAIKYSAIPLSSNTGRPLAKGQNVLRDELARHVAEDSPAVFEFALQLLDASRMTFKGQSKEPSFWIENASVEWPEEQAPFHVVGRLTLQAGALVPDDECQAMFIDVTKYSLPEHRPLGSINRARRLAESASREARLGAAPIVIPETPPSLAQRLGAITIGSIAKAVGALALLAGLLVLFLAVVLIVRTNRGDGMLPPERVERVIYQDQGWGPGLEAQARQTYYYTAQGAVLKDVRYSWFRALEMPWSKRKLSDPEIMRRYGFLVDPATPANRDGLPVGFTKHYDQGLNEEVLDITCAACHTGQINVTRNGRTTALRIDGGSALHAFTNSDIGHFVPTLTASLVGTLVNPFKFNRFAKAVLGEGHRGGRWALRAQMLNVAGEFGRLAWNEKVHGLVPTEEGYGRTDALARIANTVFGDHIEARNYAVANAPVNFPPVWNIWKFDWVQYNASVSQPMARNIGETMGTGAKYALLDRYGRPLPPDERYRSSTMLENLYTIEQTLRTLQPPQWNEELLGPIDRAKAARGKQLFNQYCVACHGPHIAPPEIKTRNAPLKGANDPEWLVKTLCVDDIGTDPNTALNFYDARVDLTKTGLTAEDLRDVARKEYTLWNQRQADYLNKEITRASKAPDSSAYVASLQQELAGLNAAMEQELSEINPASLSVGAGLSYLGMMIREKAYTERHYTDTQRADYDGFGILDMPQVLPSYKPRPLAGIWASPPFLHNGSVPTIYDLLSPVSERPKTFLAGSREYDTRKLGLAQPSGRYWTFDTSKDGNHNSGHEFNTGYKPWKEGDPPAHGLIGPLLTPDERLAIIEHLKVRNDDVDGPQEPHIPSSSRCTPPPPRADAAKRVVW